MTDLPVLSPKQLEYIKNSTKHWNLAHGSMRSGKTICSAFRFMQAVYDCPDSDIWMIGFSSKTIYNNVIWPLFESPELSIYRPYLAWSPGNRELHFAGKTIKVLGGGDEGALGAIQGATMSLCLCDEMTLFPVNVINLIDTRLSRPHSMGFATMNPGAPSHPLKEWIDKAEAGDPNYYALHFTLFDNPFVDDAYKQRIRNSLSGLYYKRNFLGLWCMAEGAIFDFFDRGLHVKSRPPRAAEYWIAGIDVGTSNAFAALIIGVNTGIKTQQGKCLWVEKEYYWDSKKTHRQKTNGEYADDLTLFFQDYDIKSIYIDPSAASMKAELRKRHFPIVDADNDVEEGIKYITSEMRDGNLYVMDCCSNLIKEIENYVWDPAKSKRGEDAPLKEGDHACDAMRYACYTHKVPTYDPYKQKHDPDDYRNGRFNPGPRRF